MLWPIPTPGPARAKEVLASRSAARQPGDRASGRTMRLGGWSILAVY